MAEDNLSLVKLRLLSLSLMLTTAVLLSNATDVFERTTSEHSSSEEFCTGETFRPRCSGGKDDVIVILTARYGRMSFGRCLVEDSDFAPMAKNPRFVGCSHDVKHILDQQCSGLSECDVRINDQNFDGLQPCLVGLKMHLEASFLCLKVAAESRHCTIPLANEPQHIVGGGRSRQVQTDKVGCGTESQPWSIEALSGQRIAVSLIDFESASERVSSRPMSSCYPLYGHIVDKNSRTNKSICGNQQSLQEQRTNQKTLYVSKSNQLQVIINSDGIHKFIVRIEASGCSDLAPPSDSAWLKRVDDQITVGCYLSRQSWKLNCVNGVWTGTVGVCSEEELLTDTHDSHPMIKDLKMPQESSTLLLVAVAGAGCTLCCLVICIGIGCLSRQQRLTYKKSCKTHLNSADESINTGTKLQSRNLLLETGRSNYDEGPPDWSQGRPAL